MKQCANAPEAWLLQGIGNINAIGRNSYNSTRPTPQTMKKFSPSLLPSSPRHGKSRRSQRRADEKGGDPFPKAPTVQIEHIAGNPGSPGVTITTRAGTGMPPPNAKPSSVPGSSPRGVAEVQAQNRQASRPYRRQADRFADDAQTESDEGEGSNISDSYYDDEETEEHDEEEANSSASSDFHQQPKHNSHRRRPSSRTEESLDDEDDTIDDDEEHDVDDQSADSYMEGADLLGTGKLMQNVFAFGTFKDDLTVGNDTVDDDDEDDEDYTVDDGDESVSSRDRRALKLCYRLGSNDHRLTEIDIDCSNLTREMAKEMAELFPQNNYLQRIRLKAPSNKTSMANFRHLVGGIGKNASVTDLQIRSTHLSREAAGHLGRALATNTSLRKLCLRSCRFDGSALPVLFLGMQHNNRINELYILQCDLSEPCNADVVSASVPLLKLQSLCLIDARLTLAGLRFLVDNLERTPSLTQLNLSINRKVGMPAAIRLLGDMLESTKMINLTSVSLSSCALDPHAVGELAKSLEDNATLTSLNLSGNRFGDDGAKHLRNLLERNQNIKEVVVKGCDITKRRQKAIDDGLKYNNSLLKSLFSKETSLSIFDAVEKIEEFGNSVTGAAKEGVEMARGGR